MRLVSPQHWAQSIQQNHYHLNPPECITASRYVKLIWSNNKFCKTIPLGLKDNVATLYSSPGFEKFHSFCAEAEISQDDMDEPVTCFECTSILEEEVDDETEVTYDINRSFPLTLHDPKNGIHFANGIEHAITSRIHIQNKVESHSLQLLQFHNKYGYIPFSRLQQMAKDNIIPSHLQHASIPACGVCLYGRATRRPWRHKTPKNTRQPKQITKPGEQVSVDMKRTGAPCVLY